MDFFPGVYVGPTFLIISEAAQFPYKIKIRFIRLFTALLHSSKDLP